MANASDKPGTAAALTPGAAFVVHLAVRSADSATNGAPECGRVEHVLSGVATHFNSISDLVSFMGEAIARRQGGEESLTPATDRNGRPESATDDSS